MKHVSILLLHQVNLGSMENARQGLLEANNYLKIKGQPEIFKVELVGIEPEVKLNKGLYSIKPDKSIHQLKKTDLIIIPPIQDDLQAGIQANKGFLNWIINQYGGGAELVSLCLGAFILGSTGLLDGKKCATHWMGTNQFKALFPKADLVPDRLMTDDNGIYTGGGAFSSANLILYIIEKFIGREAAIYCSKVFQVDMGRHSQSEFIIFSGQKDHADDAVKNIQEYVEQNFQEKIIVAELCFKFNMVRRTLERRFKQATSNTLVEYIQRVRVEAAKRDLEKTRKPINEVMYDVGYADAKSFREVFKKYSGISPVDYKYKYGLWEKPLAKI